MQYKIPIAEDQLSRLIDAALAGEEAVIAEGETPVARIVPIPRRRKFKFGLLKELAGTEPDFFEPMTEEELADWEGRDGGRFT